MKATAVQTSESARSENEQGKEISRLEDSCVTYIQMDLVRNPPIHADQDIERRDCGRRVTVRQRPLLTPNDRY